MSGTVMINAKAYFAARLPWVWAATVGGLSLPMVASLVTEATLAWIVDLAVHWQWQYAVAALASSLIYLALQRSRWAVAMVATSVTLAALNFGLLNLGRIEQSRGEPGLMVACFNLNLDNQKAPGLDAWVQSSKPDVLALFELTPQHAPLIERLKKSLPHAVMQMQDDPFGVAILSKMPLDGAQVKHHLESTPFIEASLKVHGRSILIRAIHPMPPISGPDRQTRDSLINEASRVNGEPLVVLGDFNASPWTPVMRGLAAKGVKRATTLMPTQNLYGGLPIDHVLASDAHWHVIDAGRGGNHGSDHNLVWAHLAAR